MHVHEDPNFRVLTVRELHEAMKALNLNHRALSRNLLMGKAGEGRIQKWLEGKDAISGPASAAIRLWMAQEGHWPAPRIDRRKRLWATDEDDPE